MRIIPFDRRKKYFELTQSEDKQWEATLKLLIQNRGNNTIDRFYWEIFIEKDIFSNAQPIVSNIQEFSIEKKIYQSMCGYTVSYKNQSLLSRVLIFLMR